MSAILRDIYGKFKRNSSTTTISTGTNSSNTTTLTLTHTTTNSTSGSGSSNNRGSSRGGLEMYTMLCVNDDNELDDLEEDIRV